MVDAIVALAILAMGLAMLHWYYFDKDDDDL